MPKRFHILFHLSALFAVCFVGVDALYRYIGAELAENGLQVMTGDGGAGSAGERMPVAVDYRVVSERALFGKPPAEPAVPPPEPEEIVALEPTTLKLTLLGTIAGDQRNARAVIRDDTTRTQDIYRLEDTVQGAAIRKILRGKVVLRVGDRDEILTMAEDTGTGETRESRPPSPVVSRTSGAGETRTIDRQVVQESINNINQLLAQVRIRPYFRRGKAEGLIVSQIKSGSIFQQLGLRNGDIIKTVNGNDIKSPEDVFNLYKQLESGSRVSIELLRHGRNQTLNYNLE